MTEVWFPYGGVETLVTIQVENLGAMVEPSPERQAGTTDRLSDVMKYAIVFVCDSCPPTLELLKELVGTNVPADTLQVIASSPKTVESEVPALKGKVAQAPRASEGEPLLPIFAGQGRKVFLGTARPDPLFGIIDSRVLACLDWFPGARRETAEARKDFEPTPFSKTASYEKAEELTSGITDARFFSVVPRGGKARSVLENPSFNILRNEFLEASLSPARGIIVGAGGRGNDDTFSSSLRSVWGALAGVRKSGEVLLISECAGGLGSRALEMLALGRLSNEPGRKEKGVDGLEEVFYLTKLKEEYSVLLLSGLPELFAKSKLGLTTAKGSAEAVGRMLNKLGRSSKVNVVTRAPECRLGQV